jgi:PIN domain nuclease of toxin-antitoxin system
VKHLLDTHTWIWWNARPSALSRQVRGLISRSSARDELLLSAISVWEFSKLVERGRLSLSCDLEQWIDTALDIPGLRLVPLTPRISLRSTTLPQPFHTDPADQIIVATAREENATILTKDERLHAYPHVRSRW